MKNQARKLTCPELATDDSKAKSLIEEDIEVPAIVMKKILLELPPSNIASCSLVCSSWRKLIEEGGVLVDSLLRGLTQYAVDRSRDGFRLKSIFEQLRTIRAGNGMSSLRLTSTGFSGHGYVYQQIGDVYVIRTNDFNGAAFIAKKPADGQEIQNSDFVRFQIGMHIQTLSITGSSSRLIFGTEDGSVVDYDYDNSTIVMRYANHREAFHACLDEDKDMILTESNEDPVVKISR